MPKNTGNKAKYDRQWEKTAKNKIRRITSSNGDLKIAEKYKVNPKWRGSKRPVMKGRNTRFVKQ